MSNTPAQENPIVAFARARVPDPMRPFTLTVSVRLKEGTNAEYEAAFAKALQATRQEAGCLTYDLNRDADDARRYIIYERWQTLADLEAHLNSAHIQALRQVAPALVDGPAELRILLPAAE